MWENLLSEGVGLAVGIVISALGAGVYISKKFTTWLTKHKLRRGVLATGEIYELLAKTQHNIGAKKGMLIAAHNGGSFINPLHPPHISILAETLDGKATSVKQMWQNRVADSNMVTMLSELLSKNRITAPYSKFVGNMKKRADTEGTKGVVIQYVGIMGVMVVLLHFSFANEKVLNSYEELELEQLVHEIRKRY